MPESVCSEPRGRRLGRASGPRTAQGVVPIRSHFDYLVKKQYKYGYSVFLNISICANNMEMFGS